MLKVKIKLLTQVRYNTTGKKLTMLPRSTVTKGWKTFPNLAKEDKAR